MSPDHGIQAYRYAIELKQRGYVIRAWPSGDYGKVRLGSFCADESDVIREYSTAGPPACGGGGTRSSSDNHALPNECDAWQGVAGRHAPGRR